MNFPFFLFVLFPVSTFAGGASVIWADTSELFARVGERQEINATVSSPDALQNYSTVEIYHRNVLTSNERLLARMEDFNQTTHIEDGYSINIVAESALGKTFSIVIESVSFQDDGAIDFDIKSIDGRDNRTNSRDIRVVVAPESVKMKLGDRDAIDTNSTQAVKVNSGNMTVACFVENSNPAITDISLILNGNNVALTTGPVFEQVSEDERKYSSNVSAILEIPSDMNSTQTLVCRAVDHFGEAYSVQSLYVLSGAHEGPRLPVGLVVALVIFRLWHTL